MRRCFTLCLLLAALVGPCRVAAQHLSDVGDPRPLPYAKRFRTDLRVGAAWPNDDGANPAGLGGALAWQPFSSPLARRVSVYATVDYRTLGQSVDAVPCAGVGSCYTSALGGEWQKSRTSDHWLSTGFGVAADLVRTRRFSFEVRSGGALVDRFTTFGLWHERGARTPDAIKVFASLVSRGESVDDPVFGFSSFDGQCARDRFADRCHSEKVTTRQWGLAARIWNRTSTWFVGIDYARTGGWQQQLVGTIGLRFPVQHDSRARQND